MIQPWDTEEFLDEYRSIQSRTLIDRLRIYTILSFCNSLKSVPGAFAEVGVYKGGSLKIIARQAALQGKACYGFDTFTGMPPSNPEYDNHHKEGDFSDTDIESVRQFLLPYQPILVPGFFPNTAWHLGVNSFSFVHIDCDIYQSVLDCCGFFYSYMTPGGIMLFDDYGASTCLGAKRAVDEYFSYTNTEPIPLTTTQALVICHG